MIDPELADAARSLLSNAVVMMIEEEHLAVVSVPKSGGEGAHAQRLQLLGADIVAVAAAMAIIVRRSLEAADAQP